MSLPGGYATKIDAICDNQYNNLKATAESCNHFISMAWNAGGIFIWRLEDVTSADMYVKAIILEYTKERWS